MYRFFVDKSAGTLLRPFAGVQMTTNASETMTLSLVEMEPGAVIPEHRHPHEQVGMLLEGEGCFTIGDEVVTVRPGMMWRIPGNVPHTITAGPEGLRALDVFHPVREDYR
jgi:quercetin dioxygenase-like cupin family protein